MSSIKELEEQAQELIDFGNSKEKAEGRGMMRVIKELSSNYTPDWKAVSWSEEDFEGRAKELWTYHRDEVFHDNSIQDVKEEDEINPYKNAEKWEDVYDSSKFTEALERMISKHDAEVGINWQTIDFWLDEICLKN